MPRQHPRRAFVLVSLLILGASGACRRPPETPEAVAREFLDRYFVELDHPGALQLCDGVARAKIEEEIRRLADSAPSADEERSRIYYRQVSTSTQTDGVALRFRLTVAIPQEVPVEPEVLLRLRVADGKWRVSNFEMLPLGVVEERE